MSSNRLIWVLRVLVALLFVASALMKLFPIQAFEKQLVDLGIINWCLAPALARGIIAFELFLGFGFLQNHFFKKFIMPLTVGMLVAFIIHLSIQIIQTGNTGNCGCMGQVIPMTPLEAIIKNVITIGIIGFIYFNSPRKEGNLHRYPLLILIGSVLAIFLTYKMDCCCDVKPISIPVGVVTQPIQSTIDTAIVAETAKTVKDTAAKAVVAPKDKTKSTVTPKEAVVVPKDTVKVQEPTMPRVVSEFAPYTQFSDGKVVNLDAGKNIVCVFNTTCDHCMETAKGICEASKMAKLPPVRILFWSEMDAKGEALDKEIAAFFKFTGCSHPYTVVNVGTFFRMLGKAPSPPRVAVLNEGNIVGDFSSLNFSKEALIKAVK